MAIKFEPQMEIYKDKKMDEEDIHTRWAKLLEDKIRLDPVIPNGLNFDMLDDTPKNPQPKNPGQM